MDLHIGKEFRMGCFLWLVPVGGGSSWRAVMKATTEAFHVLNLLEKILRSWRRGLWGYRKHLWHWKERIASSGYVALDCRFGLSMEIGWERVLLVVWEDSERAL